MAGTRTTLDINYLTGFLERVKSYTPDLIYQRGGRVQEVHHYTDLACLQGIAGKHDLWLTHSRFSNDDEELTHGYGVVEKVIDQRLRRSRGQAQRAFLEALRAALYGPTPEAVYICCFCEHGDLLSQWRAYGANGSGVSLAFDPQGFSYITGPDSPSYGLVRLWSVLYGDERQRHIVDEAIDFGAGQRGALAERVARAVEVLRFFIPTFKNKRFEEENEIRLIFTPDAATPVPAPDFRVARGMLVPYYRLHTLCGSPATPRPLPLRKACVGPSVRKELNAQSARLLLAGSGYGAVEVDVSTTPYRG